jgi:hypothetical protein
MDEQMWPTAISLHLIGKLQSGKAFEKMVKSTFCVREHDKNPPLTVEHACLLPQMTDLASRMMVARECRQEVNKGLFAWLENLVGEEALPREVQVANTLRRREDLAGWISRIQATDANTQTWHEEYY